MVYCLFFSNLFLNLDIGILPAGSIDIKHEMGLSNTGFGSLGSVTYLGQMIGAASTTYLLKEYRPKNVLILCLGLNIGALIVFTITNKLYLLLICRLLSGINQIVFQIYFPVWADTYGSKTQSAKWISSLLITTPIGGVLGYILCAVM